MKKYLFIAIIISVFGCLFILEPPPSQAAEESNFAGSVLRTSANWCCNSNAVIGSGTGSCYSVSGSDYIELGDFGFSIPLTDVITGIEVTVDIGTSFTSTTRLLKSGSTVGNSISGGSTATGSCNAGFDRDYGSDTELWGTTWTPAEVNAADFGVRVTARNASLDTIRITVYHNNPNVDLTSSKTTVGSITSTSISDGNNGAWTWQVQVQNSGTATASYTNNQVILSDNLPSGVTYGTPTISSSVVVK